VDRWTTYYNGGTLTVENGRILLTPADGQDNVSIWQTPDYPHEEYYGKTFTAAMMDETGKTYIVKIPFLPDASWRSLRFGDTPVSAVTYNGNFGIYADAAARIKRLKLEEGETFTGFEIKGRQERLAECQRHQLSVMPYGAYKKGGAGFAMSDTSVSIGVPVPVTMRANPQIETSGPLFLSSATSSNNAVQNIVLDQFSAGEISLAVTSQNLTPGASYILHSADAPATLILNANL
jgi:hypothetical protein